MIKSKMNIEENSYLKPGKRPEIHFQKKKSQT